MTSVNSELINQQGTATDFEIGNFRWKIQTRTL